MPRHVSTNIMTPPTKKKKGKQKPEETWEEAAETPVEGEPPVPTKLQDMTEEELLAKAKEYKALSQRMAADYANLQRETEERIKLTRKYAGEQLLLEIAPLVDYFNSAFETVPEDLKNNDWLKGVKYIQAHLLKVLEDNNVELINAAGETFDAELHEAISEEESDEPDNTILKQVQAGFKLNGKVVRCAKVVVAGNPPEDK